MNAENLLNLIEKIKEPDEFDIDNFINLHAPRQREYINAKSRTIFAWGAKRSGKSLASTSKIIIKDLTNPSKARIEIAGATLEKVKLLYWRNLMAIAKNLKLKYEFRNGDSMIVTPNREIVFRSLRDIGNADKSVGFSVCSVFIEEPQTIRSSILKYYLNNVIRINLLNIPDAQINITGNPPVVANPYLTKSIYENKEIQKIHFVPTDNPSITPKVLQEFLKIEAKELGYSSVEEALEKSNELKRNVLGLWVQDTGRLIVNPDRVKKYINLPKGHENFKSVIGVDIGGGQAKDALVAIIYNNHEKKAWVAEELELDSSDMDIEDLATNIKRFYEKYKPHAIAFDYGGVGSRLAGVLRTRYGIPSIIPAKKVDKIAWLETMRAEIYKGRLLFPLKSQLLEEFEQIIYTKDKLAIDDKDGLHSDLIDACLYSFRHVYNAWPKPRPAEKSYKQIRIEEILKAKKRLSFGY